MTNFALRMTASSGHAITPDLAAITTATKLGFTARIRGDRLIAAAMSYPVSPLVELAAGNVGFYTIAASGILYLEVVGIPDTNTEHRSSGISQSSIVSTDFYLIEGYWDTTATPKQRVALWTDAGVNLIDASFSVGTALSNVGFGTVHFNGSGGVGAANAVAEFDWLAIWNGAPPAIATTPPAHSASGLLARFLCDEGSGNTATDSETSLVATISGTHSWVDLTVQVVDHVDISLGSSSVPRLATTTATGLAKNASNVTLANPVTYTSRDPTIASVDTTTGVVTAILAGTARIYASCSGIDSADATLTVTTALTLVYSGTGTKSAIRQTAEAVRVQVPDFTPTTFATTVDLADGASIDAAIAALTTSTGNVLITLAPGGHYAPFTVKEVSGTGFVVVQTRGVSIASTVRMTPALAASHNLAQIVHTTSQSSGVGCVTWQQLHGHVPNRWVVRWTWGVMGTGSACTSALYNIGLGTGDGSSVDDPHRISDLPTYIAFTQNCIQGTSEQGTQVPYLELGCRAGIGIEGAFTRVVGNWTDNNRWAWYGTDSINDSQGIRLFWGPGPCLIENNFLEASSECIAFGGGRQLGIDEQVTQADYTIQGNHLFRRMSWTLQPGEAANSSTLVRQGCKNGFEMKQGRRVWFRNNIIENIACDQQHGEAIMIYSIDQQNVWHWPAVTDVLIEYNWFKNCYVGVQINNTYGAPFDAIQPDCVTVRHNVGTGMHNAAQLVAQSGLQSGGHGFMPSGYVANVEFSHNTMLVTQAGSETWWMETVDNDVFPAPRFVLKNNILGIPNDASAQVWVDARQISMGGFTTGQWDNLPGTGRVWDYNSVVDPQGVGHATSPQVVQGAGTHNNYLSSNAALDLVNVTRAYDLTCTLAQLSDLIPNVTSPAYHTASDGTNKGADIATIQTRLAGVRAADADLPA